MHETFDSLKSILEEKYLSSSDTISLAPPSPEEIREALQKYDFAVPRAGQDLLLETKELLDKWTLNSSHKRYWGLFNGPAHSSSVVADALVAAYNLQLSTWSHSGAAAELECHVVRFFLDLFGLGSTCATGHFTSGGSESNMTALLCALNRQFPAFRTMGVGSARPVLYVSEYAHHSIQKAAASVGIGLCAVRVVPTDEKLRMDVKRLHAMIEGDLSNGLAPFCVVGSAGTTSAGAIDPLREIADLCSSFGIWFHIDAAWGGAAMFSERLKPLLDGIQCADSITFDAHKWMAVSMGAGLFLCKDKSIVEQSFNVSAHYMPQASAGSDDLHKLSMQWSRRFIGLKVFFALCELGKGGFEKQIDHQTSVGDELRRQFKDNGWIVVNDTPLPVVCFTHSAIREGRVSTQELLQALYERKSNWISETSIKSEKVLRACVTHPESSKSDAEFLVKELQECLSALTFVP